MLALFSRSLSIELLKPHVPAHLNNLAMLKCMRPAIAESRCELPFATAHEIHVVSGRHSFH
eukprot:16171445-Heterocapsa_arctica.AAC.1